MWHHDLFKLKFFSLKIYQIDTDNGLLRDFNVTSLICCPEIGQLHMRYHSLAKINSERASNLGRVFEIISSKILKSV